MKIDYTELEANSIKVGLLNDQSGSTGNHNATLERNTPGNRRQQRIAVHSESVSGVAEINSNGKRNSREVGRRISPDVATRTGERGELNTDYQKADSEQEPAFSMSKQGGEGYVDNNNDEGYNENGGEANVEQSTERIFSVEESGRDSSNENLGRKSNIHKTEGFARNTEEAQARANRRRGLERRQIGDQVHYIVSENTIHHCESFL